MSFWVWREHFDRWIEVVDYPTRDDVTDCPRCHQAHGQLEFFELTGRIEVGWFEVVTHWGICPTTGQPVLMGTCDLTPLIHPQRVTR